jgi:hypothetical protein
MWLRARERTGDERIRLTVDDYTAIGGLSGALNAHANQIFDELGKARWPVVEWIFRALTAGSSIADAVRRPTRFGELVAACGGDEAAVRAVVDAFRAPGVNFLVPEFDPREPVLAPDVYVDISHESLIRQWKKLSEWLETEGRAAQQWRRLIDRFGTGEMLRGRELANLVAWRRETKPNAAWAKRYGGDYPAVIGFLDRSQRSQNVKRAWMIGSAAGVLLLIVVQAIYANYTRIQAQQALVRAEAEQERAEANKQHVLRILEGLVFDTGPLIASRGGSSRQMLAARHAQDSEPVAPSEQRDGNRDTPAASESQIDAAPESLADRAAAQSTDPRVDVAVIVSTMLRDHVRELSDNNPDDSTIGRTLAGSLILFGHATLQSGNFDAAEKRTQTGRCGSTISRARCPEWRSSWSARTATPTRAPTSGRRSRSGASLPRPARTSACSTTCSSTWAPMATSWSGLGSRTRRWRYSGSGSRSGASWSSWCREASIGSPTCPSRLTGSAS